MYHQVPALALKTVVELYRLDAGAFGGEYNVSQFHTFGIRIIVPRLRHITLTVQPVKERERQHIRRRVDVAVLTVQFTDARVVCHRDVHLYAERDPLMTAGRL